MKIELLINYRGEKAGTKHEVDAKVYRYMKSIGVAKRAVTPKSQKDDTGTASGD